MIFINHREIDDKIVTVEIKGELNSITSSDFEEYINQLLDNNKKYIILDSKNLDYVSSAGIGVILYIQKKIISMKGVFIICNISEEINSLYELLGFDKIIKIVNNAGEAISIIEKQMDLLGDKAPELEVKENITNKENSRSTTISEVSRKEHSVSGSKRLEKAEEKVFDEPIILECSECKSMIRVKKGGDYICPDCKTEFHVENDQTVVF